MITKNNIIIRDANIGDVDFIAWTTVTALDININSINYAELVNVCLNENTLYSLKNARICEVNGIVAGCLIAYGGDNYINMKKHTENFIKTYLDPSFYSSNNETQEGEFYLDSMAVKENFRGYGLGKHLILDGINKGKGLGYTNISLLVSGNKYKLMNYYKSIGFQENGTIFTFGENFIKLTYRI